MSQQPTQSPQSGPESRAPSVLIVDDEDLVLAALVRLLSRENLDVTTANHPIVAMTILEERRFDLVIVDHRLRHNTTGLELLERVRRRWP